MTNPISTDKIFTTLTTLYNKNKAKESSEIENDIWRSAYDTLAGDDSNPVSVQDMLNEVANQTGVNLNCDDLKLAQTLLTAATENDSTFDSVEDFEKIESWSLNSLASNPDIEENTEILQTLGLNPTETVQPKNTQSISQTSTTLVSNSVDIANAPILTQDDRRTIHVVENSDGTKEYYLETQLTKNEHSYKKIIINEDGTYISIRCDANGKLSDDTRDISFEKEKALIDTVKEQMNITQEYIPYGTETTKNEDTTSTTSTSSSQSTSTNKKNNNNNNNNIEIGDNTFKIVYNNDGSIYQIVKQDKNGLVTKYKRDDARNFTEISLEILNGMDRSTAEGEAAFREMYDNFNLATYIQNNFSGSTETEKLIELAEILDGGNFKSYTSTPSLMEDKFLSEEYESLANGKSSITNVIDALNNDEIDIEQALYCLGKFYDGDISKMIKEFRGMTSGNEEKYIDNLFTLLLMTKDYTPNENTDTTAEAEKISSAESSSSSDLSASRTENSGSTDSQPAQNETISQSQEEKFSDETIKEYCKKLYELCDSDLSSDDIYNFFKVFDDKPNELIAFIDEYVTEHPSDDCDIKYQSLFNDIVWGLYNNSNKNSKSATEPMISTLFEAAESTNENLSNTAISIIVDALYTETHGLNPGYAQYLLTNILEQAKCNPEIFEKIQTEYNKRDIGHANLCEELITIDGYSKDERKTIKSILDTIVG